MAMDLLTSTTRWISCLFLVAAIGGEISVHATEFGAVAANSAAIKSLGRIVYLPKVNLQSDHNSDRLIFDAKDVNSIAEMSNESYANVNFKWFESSDNFKKSIAAEMGVSGSAKGVSMSVESEFNRVTGSETNVKVAEVHAVRFHSKTYIPRGHDFNNLRLNEAFVKDFKKLPVLVKDSHLDNAWSSFRDFMNSWGSHIVHVAYTGAVYQHWSSARSDLHYSEHQMKAKTCVTAEGLKPVGALQVCAGYSQSDRQDSAKLTTFDSKRVKGGTAGTRSKLATSLATPELLEKFLNEDAVDLQPVRYEYYPVWDFLRSRSNSDDDDNRRALGLQAYYEGWRATGCPLVKTTGQDNNNAQAMVPEYNPSTKKHTGYYLCIRRCIGCHEHSADCHYNYKSACCRLYGPSAITVHDWTTDRASLTPDADHGWCAYSNGCVYKSFSGCLCLKANQEPGCNYIYPMNAPSQTWLKYKIIWNQHSLTANEENPTIASVVDA